MITLTANAQQAVSRFIRGSEKIIGGLRISVSGGGCAGMQYGMALEPCAGANDYVVEAGEFDVYVDPESAPMLMGVTVDFMDSVDGSGFKFVNPNACAGCSCGD